MHMYQYVGLHFTVHHIKSYSSVNRTLQYGGTYNCILTYCEKEIKFFITYRLRSSGQCRKKATPVSTLLYIFKLTKRHSNISRAEVVDTDMDMRLEPVSTVGYLDESSRDIALHQEMLAIINRRDSKCRSENDTRITRIADEFR